MSVSPAGGGRRRSAGEAPDEDAMGISTREFMARFTDPKTGIISGDFGLVKKSQHAPGGISKGGEKSVEEATPASDAKAKMLKKRKTSILSGGETDVTRGRRKVPEGSVGRKSLLGE